MVSDSPDRRRGNILLEQLAKMIMRLPITLLLFWLAQAPVPEHVPMAGLRGV